LQQCNKGNDFHDAISMFDGFRLIMQSANRCLDFGVSREEYAQRPQPPQPAQAPQQNHGFHQQQQQQQQYSFQVVGGVSDSDEEEDEFSDGTARHRATRSHTHALDMAKAHLALAVLNAAADVL